MKWSTHLVFLIAIVSFLPLVSANPTSYIERDYTVMNFAFPWTFIVPLIADAIALGIGLFISRSKISFKKFLAVFLALWAIGYPADLFVTFFMGAGLFTASVVSFLIIYLLDFLILTKLFKFERRTSAKISIVMGILTNMFILVLIGTLFGQSLPAWYVTNPPNCVSNPMNELVTSLSKAMGGIVAESNNICLSHTEGFTSEALMKKISGVNSITFKCFEGASSGKWVTASICSGTSAPINVNSSSIKNSWSTATVPFSTQVECHSAADGSGEYDCLIQIKDPPR